MESIKTMPLLGNYETRKRNKFIVMIFMCLLLLVPVFTVSADYYTTDEVYGTSVARGAFSDFCEMMIEKICDQTITAGAFYEALSDLADNSSSFSVDETLAGYASDTSLDVVNGENSDVDAGALNSVANMLTVWFKVEDGEIAAVGMGGDSLADSNELTSVSDFINTCNEVCRSVAVTLLVIFFCINIMQSYLDGNNYEEMFLKKFIMLGFSIALVYFIQVICAEFSNLGSQIVVKLANWEDTSNTAAQLYAYIYKYVGWTPTSGEFIKNTLKMLGSFLESCSAIILIGVPWLVCLGCELMMRVTVLSRFIELLVLIALSPLAMCTVGSRSGTEHIMRFIKQFLVVCLQGAVIFVICRFVTLIRNDALSDFMSGVDGLTGMFNALITVAMVTVVQVGLVGRSRQIAQTIVGN